MKKILFIALLTGIIFSACKKSNFLDNKTNVVDETAVFTDSVRTIAFLSRIYSDMGWTFHKERWENGNTDNGTDDSEYTLANPVRRSVVIYNASWTPDQFFFEETNRGMWATPYTNIRRVNLLLSKLNSTTLPLAASTKKRVAAEARFLRAWFYHKLTINFGGVPVIGDKVFGITDEVNIPRSTYAETIDYIVKELDEVAAILPRAGVSSAPGYYEDKDFGRVTKGAALALKSRVLLFAASPLFNGGDFPNPSSPEKVALASYPTYSVARWAAAAKAAEDVINLQHYQLVKDNATAPGYGFYQLFLKRINTEYILFVNRAANKDFEPRMLPVSRGGSRNLTPTQTLVDAFPMANGKAITDPTSGYDATKPYVGREPRFYYSIIYNGARFMNANTGQKDVVNTYVGASDGFVLSASTIGNTGYYSRKMLDENIAANSSANTERGWPLIRYAEILLNYAEAMNETGNTDAALEKMKEIRDRAGVQPGPDGRYGIKSGITVAEMRKLIAEEKHIEFMYEEQRWDDVRRLKIAMQTQNGYNKCMMITRTVVGGVENFTYQVVNSTQLHRFFPNSYIMPIPTGELRKAPAMIQNPGY